MPSTANNNGHIHHNGVALMDDLDDSKYDRRIKRRLRKQRGLGGASTMMTPRQKKLVLILGVAVTIIISMVLISQKHSSYRQQEHRKMRRERRQRAEDMWKRRHETEFEGVAPHAGGGPGSRHGGSAHGGSGRDKEQEEDERKHHLRMEERNNRQNAPKVFSVHDLEQEFAKLRLQAIKGPDGNKILPRIDEILEMWLDQEDLSIIHNEMRDSPRWIRPYLLPPLPGSGRNEDDYVIDPQMKQRKKNKKKQKQSPNEFFKVRRMMVKKKPNNPDDGDRNSNNNQNRRKSMDWEEEYQELLDKYKNGNLPGPTVDYTDRNKYIYPDISTYIENPFYNDPKYPNLQTLGELMTQWPQDDDNHGTIHERLLHFNYSNLDERAVAERFRDHEIPFKLYDIPEVDAASIKWTDEYISQHFGSGNKERNNMQQHGKQQEQQKLAEGMAQESSNNYFAFYIPQIWNVEFHGLPPTRNNDWDYAKWSQHAIYADAVALKAQKPHFYWQSGVSAEERYKSNDDAKTFITRDLPSFSTTTDNFFVFHVKEQKGIQCRFGERGVVAATHYDGGRNMIAMMTGAKRYILSPPNQCTKLGIFTNRKSPIYRHSLLNFGHINYLDDNSDNTNGGGMSPEERAWLERASSSQAIETVLKKGEVLYLPSHWFHYIISLQKSAQCNVRSGIDEEGNPRFGGKRSVVEECSAKVVA